MLDKPEKLGSTILMERPVTCPGCKSEQNAGTCVNVPKSAPTAGDYSVCNDCGRLSKFFDDDGHLDLRDLTDDEYAAIPAPALAEIASLSVPPQ